MGRAQSLGITAQEKQGTTVIQIEFVCVTSSFFGGVSVPAGERGLISKETAIIFHVTVKYMGAVRLTNDRASSAVESEENLRLLMSVIF